MNQPTHGRLLVLLLIGALPACTADPAESASAQPTPPAATPEATASPESPEPTEDPTPTQSASPSFDAGPGGFTVAPHPEADSLFLDRDDCENVDDGYRLQYPAEWSTNDAGGTLPACSWFAAEPFAGADPAAIPDEVAITVELLQGDSAAPEDVMSEEEVMVGGTQTATRTEFEDDGTTMYEYVVQLGPPGEGPVLLARTDTDMGGDYDLNKAVLDRIMATMEFIGTTQ